ARPPAGSGEQVFRAALKSAPGRVDVLTLGPPTELAAVLLRGGIALRAQDPVGDHDGRRSRRPREHHMAPYDQEPACRMELLRRSESGERRVPLWATDYTRPARRDERRAPERGRRRAARKIAQRCVRATPDQVVPAVVRALLLGPARRRRPRQPAIGRYANSRLAVIESVGPESGRTVRA